MSLNHLLLCLFISSKNGKLQKRGKINFIGRLQLSTDKHREEDNEAIAALRILRTQVLQTVSSYTLYRRITCRHLFQIKRSDQFNALRLLS